MASPRIASPMRGVSYQLSRLSLRQDAVPKPPSASFARSITTSTCSQAAVSSITTSVDGYVPVKPFEEQSVLATIHKFPSLEPLRLQSYPANYLNLPTRRDILHRAVIYEGDMTRLGTAHAKTRYEVRGSARKIRPQKGSGRARLGDKKSPMLRGGGVSHGPSKHRDFTTHLPRKVYDLAWRTALSYRWRKGELIIVDNAIELESPSKRLLDHIFEVHDRERGRGRSLLVTSQNRPLLEQTLEKMDRRRQALTWEEVDVKDLLELSRIIIERQALWDLFNSHRSDLQSYQPPFELQRRPKGPAEYDSITGWQQFRALMTASPAERESVRAEAYESTAFERWQRAEALPETSPEKVDLTIAAYELLAEAKDLRRQQLPIPGSLKHIHKQKENHAMQLAERTLEADDAVLEASEAQVALCERNLTEHELFAQAAEHRRDAFRWKNKERKALHEEHLARRARTRVENAEGLLLEARKDFAIAKAQVLKNNEEWADADKWQAEASELEEQLETRNEELAKAELAQDEFDEEIKSGMSQAHKEEAKKL